ncbi:polysaccharide biosynthesis protein [Streptococcus pseudoporcinus]|uniref:Polysaccharide biosynthesis protein n=1 Tax=Streptococcus pseudoporcinus TaxID=361101 RepID=A0A4U9XIY5_9STRE|nr:oligosaccharide flippase family protein [Streptococcus pseudoporcinus]VTS13194.1 polysaccharide biosynthesis protein [Streptococcus pseudoporcinus]
MKLKTEKLENQVRKSSLVITLSGLISKILAAIYRIPYQNIVGDRGFYAYQQVYPLLAIISALSLTALPNVVASIFQKNKNEDLQILFRLQMFISLIFALLLMLFCRPLAIIIGSEKLIFSIIITALILLTVPFNSFYRGLAQARVNMIPTAVSQVMEQIIRVGIIILAALFYKLFSLSIYRTANMAATGNLVASLSILIYFIYQDPKALHFLVIKKEKSETKTYSIGVSSLIFIFYTVYLLLFQFIDSLFVKNSLVGAGYHTIMAEASKGVYDRGQPLIQFGLIFSTAFFTTFLPKLTRDYYHNQWIYQHESQQFFDFICYLNMTIYLGFSMILAAMNRTLFEDNKGWLSLEIFISIIFISSLIQFFHQKLFIENRQKKSFLFLCLGLVLKVIMTPLLTRLYGIVGSTLSTILPLMLVLILYIRYANMEMKWFKNWRFMISLLAMLIMVFVVQTILPNETRIENFIEIVLASLLGLITFIFVAKRLNAFDKKLWSYLPFAKEK